MLCSRANGVLPGYQNQRIGSKLITQGFEESRSKGYDLVVALGHVARAKLIN